MVLITGTITAISPSFIVGVQAQGDPYHQMYNKYNSYEQQPREYPPKYADREYNSYQPSYEKNSYDTPPSYGNDNYQPREYPKYEQDYKPTYPSYGKDDRDKSKKDSVNINKVNCINNNVNINGNNTGDINLGNKDAAKGYLGGYSSAGGGYSGEGYGKQDKGFDCTINNNNTNTNIGGGNQTIPPVPPEQRATLNVTKTVTCADRNQDVSPICQQILTAITEDQFNIQVIGGDADPSSFAGSEAGTTVTLGAGAYTVTEDPDETSIAADLTALGGTITGPIPSFTGDCTQIGTGSFSATGDIAAGESQTCNIINHFVKEDTVNPTVTSSLIIAQGTQDSTGLTALEKIEKLKQQWLDLLP